MRSIVWPFVFLISAAGCAVTGVQGQRMPLRSEAFGAYVEEVFRRQNDVAARLSLELERESPETGRYTLLEDAELALLTACGSLNEIARARRDGERIGGLGGLRRARRTPDCELATDRAAALL
jgi:hypothetical protein